MNHIVVRHLFLLTLLIAASAAAFFLGARLGDRKWARKREEKRLATPYAPPVNSRPNDFDSKGRPW